MKAKCKLCKQNIKIIDYKNLEILKNYVGPMYKILSRKRTRLCQKHQKSIASSIKKARIMGLLPFVGR